MSFYKRYRRVHRHSKLKCFLLSIFLLFFMILVLLSYVGNKLWPIIVRYAITDATNIVTEVVNQVLQKEVIQLLNDEELFMINKDENGTITMIDFNPATINMILQRSNEVLQKYLNAIESGDANYLSQSSITLDNVLLEKVKEGRITAIPIGITTGNALLANLGPKIPVCIHFIGNVSSNVKSTVENYGINNALLSSNIQVNVRAELILPLSNHVLDISTDIPLSIKMIQGKVPSYYQSGYHDTSSLLALPFVE